MLFFLAEALAPQALLSLTFGAAYGFVVAGVIASLASLSKI